MIHTPTQSSSLKRMLFASSIISILFFLPLVLSAQVYPVSGNATLLDTLDHQPITVTIYRGPVLDTTTTDAYGDYYFVNLTFGKYYFRFTRPGYISFELDNIEINSNTFLTAIVLDTIPDTSFVNGYAHLAGTNNHSGIVVTLTSNTKTSYDTTDNNGLFSGIFLSGSKLTTSFYYPGFFIENQDSLVVEGAQHTLATVVLDSAFLIEGSALRAHKTSHANISVSATSIDSNILKSTLTAENGTFSLTIPDTGTYTIHYSAPSYLPVKAIKRISNYRTLLSEVWLDTVPPGSTYYGGELTRNTRWSKESKRFIRSDFTVGAGVTLTIEEGTNIIVAPVDTSATGDDPARVEFRVAGALDCKGTVNEPILFISEAIAPVAGQWRGIEILAGADTCRITNTTIMHGAWGIRALRGKGLLLDSSRITTNLNGVDITETPVYIDHTIITGNTSSGCDMTNALFYITNSKIISNGSNGLGLHKGKGAVFNSLIYANRGTRGITANDSVEVVLCNNTILNNGNYGIDANQARLVVLNTIISGHTSYGINNSSLAYGAGIEIRYTCMWSNGPNFRNCPDSLLQVLTTHNANGDTCDERYNIFLSPGLNNVHEDMILNGASACLEAGTALYYSSQLDDTVRTYNNEGGRPHIGRHSSMIATVTFDTTNADTNTVPIYTFVHIQAPSIAALPCPVQSIASLKRSVVGDTPIMTLTGELLGTVATITAKKIPAGMYLLLRKNGDTLQPTKILLQGN